MMILTPKPWRPRRLRRRFFTSSRHRGPHQAHFDGLKFANTVPTEKWARHVAQWMVTRNPTPWPRWLESEAEDTAPAPVERIVGADLRITVVNHSTVLIQTSGLNILTDPVWSRRVGPFPWLGPSRVRAPGIAFDDLPRIDCILLSHDHYDHLDAPTVRRLVKRDRPRLLCGLGVDRTLEIDGMHGAEPLDWYQARSLAPGVEAVFTPCRHFSGRGLKDQDSTLWGSFLLKTPSGQIYFAGDTGLGPHFAELRRRFGPVRVALLPVGCYEPRWFMRAFHMSPHDAVQAHQELEADISIGIHYGTFQLGDEGIDQPSLDLARAKEQAGLAERSFQMLAFGQPWQPSAIDPSVRRPQSGVVLAAETW